MVPEDGSESLQPVTTASTHTVASTSNSPTICSTPSTSAANGKKRKRSTDATAQETELLNRASSILDNFKKTKDARNKLDALGELVSSTLKEIKNKKLVLKAQRQINDILISIQEEDLEESENA